MVNTFFLDSSAIVKYYKQESGTTWVQNIIESAQNHQFFLSQITLAEVAAVIACMHRASDGITQQERDTILDTFLDHTKTEYQIIPTSNTIIDKAVHLTQYYRLRGCDSIQLATAIIANNTLLAKNVSPLTFVAADNDLITAAQAEDILTENPNDYPQNGDVWNVLN